MFSYTSDVLGRTGSRDKVLSIVQFVPVAVQNIVRSSGAPELAETGLKLAAVADAYRTFTRFSGAIDMLSEKKRASLCEIHDPILRNLSFAEWFFQTLFFPCENLAYLCHWGVLKTPKPRWSGITVYFWFWTLFMADLRQLYVIFTTYANATAEGEDASSVKKRKEFKRTVLGLMKTLCFTVFCLSVQPRDGAKPLVFVDPSNPVTKAINGVVALTAPKAITLSNASRGWLGLTASVIDIYLYNF